MNRYQNAQGKEEAFYQIICPVCGFKDATTDKSKWTCPECEIKTKKVVTVKTININTPEARASVAEGVKAAMNNPKTSPEVSKELNKAFDILLAMGVKPAEPAPVKEAFKVGGLQCKIISTRRK